MLIEQTRPYPSPLPRRLRLGWDDFRFAISPANHAAIGRRARWTVIAFLAGDCDLGPWLFDDLLEMKAVGSTDDVHLLAMFDGPLLADSFVARLNRGTPLGEDLLLRFNELDMSASRTLTLALQVAQAFPAERRLLILGGHGMGWKGSLLDQGLGPQRLREPAFLELPASPQDCDAAAARCNAAAQALLNEAITDPPAQPPGPLDVIAFDACYMGNLESLAVFADHARALVLSEDQMPGEGLDYRSLLTELTGSPDIDHATLLARWLGGAAAHYQARNDAAQPRRATPVTLAAVDAPRVAALCAAFVRFAQSLDPRDPALITALLDAREAVWHSPQTGLADLKGLAQQLAARMPAGACRQAAGDLIEAFDQAVRLYCGGGTPAGTNGLSIYAPHPDDFDIEYLRLANTLPQALGVWAFALGGCYLHALGTAAGDHPLVASLRATMEAAIRDGRWHGRPGAG